MVCGSKREKKTIIYDTGSTRVVRVSWECECRTPTHVGHRDTLSPRGVRAYIIMITFF